MDSGGKPAQQGGSKISRSPARLRAASWAERFAVGVCIVGIAAGAATLAADRLLPPPGARTASWLFALLLVAGELMPLPRGRYVREADGSLATTFALALLLTAGAGLAIVVAVPAVLLAGGLRHRRPLWAGFGATQRVLGLAAAGGVLRLLLGLPQRSGLPLLTAASLPAVALAGVVLVGAPWVMGSLAGLLDGGERARLRPRATLLTIALLALGPVAVSAAASNSLLVPLLVLPLIALYQSRRQSAVDEHHALHDPLTELPNRVLFRERAERAIVDARRRRAGVALMVMDLDRFKDVNDALGHHHGDLLLRQVGRRLRNALREIDTVARLGGDEFAVLLPGIDNPAACLEVADKLRGQLLAPFDLAGLAIDMGTSIGIVCYPQHGEDVPMLLQRADVAMYMAKERRSGAEIYSRDDDCVSSDRLALTAELRRALELGLLQVVYQPKIDLATERIQGVEALVRWPHPTRGMIPPAEFLPLAERTGLIRPLTVFVLQEALAQLAAWRREGLMISMAVNLSVVDMRDVRLPHEIKALISHNSVPPEALELEIVESNITAEPLRAMATLRHLHELGSRVVIDDFGSGSASLADLRNLAVDELKIDKSFVLDLHADGDDAVVVRSMIELGHSLGLRIVAKGVESEAVRAQLHDLGCDLAQGYHFSHPLPAAQLTARLRAEAELSASGSQRDS